MNYKEELRRLFLVFFCLPCTHGHGSQSSHIVHSFLTYSYSNILGQNTENYYSTKFTTGTPLETTSHYRELQYATTALARTASRRSRPCCSSSLGFVKARDFGAKGGRGRDGWAKARLEMGAGKEMSSMGGTARRYSTLSRGGVL